MLFAGFNVALRRVLAVRRDPRGRRRQRRRLVGRLRRRLLRPHRAGRAPRQKAAHLAEAPRARRPLVRSARRGTVFFARMMPIVRTFISLPAGVARMNFLALPALTFLGSIPWVLRARVRRQAGAPGLDETGRTRSTTCDYACSSCSSRASRGGSCAAGATATPSRPPASASAPPTWRRERPAGADRRADAARIPAAARGARARGAARPGRAAADLLLRARRARAVARRLALLRRSTPSCARRSRSRCTPARPRRC